MRDYRKEISELIKEREILTQEIKQLEIEQEKMVAANFIYGVLPYIITDPIFDAYKDERELYWSLHRKWSLLFAKRIVIDKKLDDLRAECESFYGPMGNIDIRNQIKEDHIIGIEL